MYEVWCQGIIHRANLYTSEKHNTSFTRLGFPNTSRHQRHRVTFFDCTHLAELISPEQFRIFKVSDIPFLDFGPYFHHNFKRFSPSNSFRPTTTIVIILPRSLDEPKETQRSTDTTHNDNPTSMRTNRNKLRRRSLQLGTTHQGRK